MGMMLGGLGLILIFFIGAMMIGLAMFFLSRMFPTSGERKRQVRDEEDVHARPM
jgi:hypothetical protein